MTSTFIGNIEARLDDKGRIFIPAPYRKILSTDDNKRVVLRRDLKNACLIIYPEDVWNRHVEQLQQRINPWDSDDNFMLQQFMADAEYLDIDSQGRVLLQKRNLQQIGVAGNDILIVGMFDRFAIWDKQTFEAKRFGSEEFAKKIQERMTK